MDLVTELTDALSRNGPPLLGVLTFLETSSLLGIFVPAGVAFLLAAVLTTQGLFALSSVIAWALVGAVLGDTAGYWLGRRGQHDPAHPRGLLGHALARLGPKKLRLLTGSPFYSISLARVISFVRTLAPLTAGAARQPYRRFAVYNALGIVLWAATYAAVGTLAGESWQRVSQYVGAAWGVVFLAAIGVGLWVRRRRRGSTIRMSVGLTGNAASGKSTVAALWRGQGVPVVDADQLAREAVAPGSDGLKAVVGAFGSGVLDDDGALDRKKLGAIVFDEPDRRRQLEAILHPRIAVLREEWMAAQARQGHDLIVSEIPLLFEIGIEAEFDAVVLVHVPRDVSYERLVAQRGLAPAEADRMLDAQLPSEEKISRSDYVIRNTASKGDLEDHAMHVLGNLRRQARSRAPRGSR